MGKGGKGDCRASHARQDDNAKTMHGAVLGGVQGEGHLAGDQGIIATML